MASADLAAKVKKEPQDTGVTPQNTRTFCFSVDGETYQTTCSTADTVLQALRKQGKFSSCLGNDTIIIRMVPHEAVIPVHFPSFLIAENEELRVEIINANRSGVGEESETDSEEGCSGSSLITDLIMGENQLLAFYVETTGGKNCKNKDLVKNKELKSYQSLCVWACRGEKVKKALRRDGRFADIAFEKGSELIKVRNDMHISITSFVDKLNGEKLRLMRDLRGKTKKDSPKKTRTNTTKGSSASEQPEPGSKSSQSAVETASENVSPPQGKQACYVSIPGSEELLETLHAQFTKDVRQMAKAQEVKKPLRSMDFVRKEFGKKVKDGWAVAEMKLLMELSDSVCQICSDGEVLGTGFLLFDNCILTNAHVILKHIDINTKQLLPSVTVAFTDDMNPAEKRCCKIQQIFGSYDEHITNTWEKYLDYAVLQLKDDPPDGLTPLLQRYGTPQEKSGICIIGHPDGGRKKLDSSFIIAGEERLASIGKQISENSDCLQWIMSASREQNWSFAGAQSSEMTYNTCFYYGSSGSPVFGEDCQLIAMHTGGYAFSAHEIRSLIEYGVPLRAILTDFLRRLVTTPNDDILRSFIVEAMLCRTETLYSFITEFFSYIMSQSDPSLSQAWSTIKAVVSESDEDQKDLLRRCMGNINFQSLLN